MQPAIRKRRVGVALTISAAVALILVGARPQRTGNAVQAATTPSFNMKSVSSMSHARAFATATTLTTGMVLITGGLDSGYNYLPTAELYDPTSQKFMVLGNMTTPRVAHSATLLPNGQVLLAGGVICSAGQCGYLASAEIFDPVARRFSAVGSMIAARANHTATLLSDGTVLFAGGNSTDALATAEIYDPGTRRFSAAGAMSSPRFFHTATLLQDGAVLVAGGRGCADECNDNSAGASAELYDPGTRRFSLTGSMSEGRILHTATLVNDGQVLITGGRACVGDCEGDRTLQNTELYDPSTQTFNPGPDMTAARASHIAVAMPSGQIFIYGGSTCSRRAGCQYLNSGEIFAPNTGAFVAAGNGSVAGPNIVAALIASQQILIAGGRVKGTIGSGAELFTLN